MKLSTKQANKELGTGETDQQLHWDFNGENYFNAQSVHKIVFETC